MIAFRSSRIFVLLFLILLVSCEKPERQAKKSATPSASNYTLGEVIRFGRGGRSERFKRGGWGDTEKDYTWTNARTARLSFTLADADQPLRLRMRLAGFTNPPLLNFQPVEVLVNDESVAEWEVSDVADYVALIPAEVANHEQFIVRLRIPEAASPKTLEVRDDPRLLGISCLEVAITKADSDEARTAMERYESDDPKQAPGKMYSFGTVVQLGLGAGGQRFKLAGWYPPEPGFAWTGKGPSVLDLSVPPSERPLRLKMKLAGLVEPETLPFQPTEVYVNSRKAAEWLVGAPAVFEAAIPSGVAAEGRLWVELRTPKATSPKELKIGNDTRPLGVRCEAFVVEEVQSDEPSPAGRSSQTPRPSPRQPR